MMFETIKTINLAEGKDNTTYVLGFLHVSIWRNLKIVVFLTQRQ